MSIHQLEANSAEYFLPSAKVDLVDGTVVISTRAQRRADAFLAEYHADADRFNSDPEAFVLCAGGVSKVNGESLDRPGEQEPVVVADYLKSNGVPSDRIRVVPNALSFYGQVGLSIMGEALDTGRYTEAHRLNIIAPPLAGKRLQMNFAALGTPIDVLRMVQVEDDESVLAEQILRQITRASLRLSGARTPEELIALDNGRMFGIYAALRRRSGPAIKKFDRFTK